MEQFDTRYFRGQGKVFIGDRDASGNPAGLIFVGDLSSGELTPNMERNETIENVTGSNGVGSTYLKRAQFNINLAMRSIRHDHLAIALHGSDTAKAAASVTDEAHNGNHDAFIRLQHTKVSSVVVTDDTGVTTYTEGTDYILYADEGMIEILSTGTITQGQALLVDYAYAAQHHVKVSPHNLDKYLVFAGKNSADNNKQTRCEMYKVKLDPGVLSLITEDTTDMAISGTLQLDTLRAAGDQFYSWKTED